MSPEGVVAGCALCGASAPLRRSHIIPRFVSRALQVPDGPTRALLCGGCEDRFSAHESTFARVVFHPLLAAGRVIAKYDKWLLQFSVSVCWRILEERLADSAPDTCRETWRQFLASQRSDLGAHPVHLLLADRNAPPETIAMEVVQSDRESFVYAKLGPVILFGLSADSDAGSWQGTRVHVEGKIKPRETLIPARYRDYLLSRAGRPATA